MAFPRRQALRNVTSIRAAGPLGTELIEGAFLPGILAASPISLKTGTVTVGASSASVVGTGTLFVAELTVGDLLNIGGYIRQVSVITDNTHVTLLSVHPGATAVGYYVMPLVYVHVIANSLIEAKGTFRGLANLQTGDPAIASGALDFFNASNSFTTTLQGGTPAGNITHTLPIRTGAIALSTWIIVSANGTTAVAGGLYQADTTAGTLTTITLPASAAVGDSIAIEDAALTWDTHNLTLARNGLKINSGTSDYTANVIGGKLCIVYISASVGWSIKGGGGAGAGGGGGYDVTTDVLYLKSSNNHYWSLVISDAGAITYTDIGTSLP